MGGSYSSNTAPVTRSAYNALKTQRKATTGYASFSTTAQIQSGQRSKTVSERLDPKGIKDSVAKKRECRDTDDAPNSNAVVVGFDVTGSLGNIPMVLQEKMVKLLPTLTTKAVLDDPAVLFAACGDVRTDYVPLQIGQFENTLAMDEDINEIYLEGNGGGQGSESYELFLFFLARLVAMDNLEKRGKKGKAFIIADERACPSVLRRDVEKIYGNTFGMESDIPLEDIVEEAKKNFEIFVIIPTGGCYGNENKTFWNRYFPEHVLELDDPDLVCETIVTAIGLSEDTIDDVDDVADALDVDSNQRNTISTALSEYKGTRNGKLAAVSGGTLVGSSAGSGLDS